MGRHLVVSNCPETIISTTGNPAVLYKETVPLSGSTTFRIYLWHVNVTNSPRTFRVRLRTSSGSLKITNRKFSQDVVANNFLQLGRELACVYKYGNFDNSPTDDKSISTTFEELWSQATNSGQLVGMVYEFSVEEVTTDTSLIIQTSCDAGTLAADVPPVPAPQNADGGDLHIRGWWPYSEILFPVGGVLEADPTNPGQPIICGVVEKVDGVPPSQGGEMPPELAPTAFGPRGDVDEYGTNQGNKGLYGATVKYEFHARNSNEDIDGGLNLKLHMRGTGGTFSGVGGTVTQGGDPCRIPTLHSNGNPKISAFDTGANLLIPKGTRDMTVVCELGVAGAATLPVNLVFSPGTIT